MGVNGVFRDTLQRVPKHPAAHLLCIPADVH